MTDPLRLGIAGLGTVGVGVVKIVQRQANLLARALWAADRDRGDLRPLPRQDRGVSPLGLRVGG